MDTCPLCGEPATPPRSQDTQDTCSACQGLLRIAGDYELGEVVSKGTGSTIYAGRRRSDGAEIAVKVMDLRGRPGWKEHDLFQRGTKMLQALRHPRLPVVHALAHDEVGRLYQVRERFEGGTLRDRVAGLGGIPSPGVVRGLLLNLLRTLQYLHSRVPPVVHRDIKPSNVMFRSTTSWDPVLIDFESVAQGEVSTGTTIVVSPGYTAPEQLGGESTPQSDLYSLSATFLHVCTGKEPDELLRGTRATAEMFEPLDRATADVLLKMLEPIPAQRTGSAAEALRQLQSPLGALVRLEETSSRVRIAKGVIAGLAAAALVFAMLSAGGSSRASRFEDALTRLAPSFARASDEVILQSAKGIAYDMELRVSGFEIERVRLHGDDFNSLMHQLERVEGLQIDRRRDPVQGDTYVVIRCRLEPYPMLGVFTEDLMVTLQTSQGTTRR